MAKFDLNDLKKRLARGVDCDDPAPEESLLRIHRISEIAAAVFAAKVSGQHDYDLQRVAAKSFEAASFFYDFKKRWVADEIVALRKERKL